MVSDPSQLRGKWHSRNRFPGDRTGAAAQAACPQAAANNWGLITCVVSRLGEEAGGE